MRNSRSMGNTSRSEDAFFARYSSVLKKLPVTGKEHFVVYVPKRHYPDFRLQGPKGTLYVEFKGYPREKWLDVVRTMSHAQKQVYRVVLEKRSTLHQGKPVTQILAELGIQHSIKTLDPRWLEQVGLDPKLIEEDFRL
jgi:hypothetical protein